MSTRDGVEKEANNAPISDAKMRRERGNASPLFLYVSLAAPLKEKA